MEDKQSVAECISDNNDHEQNISASQSPLNVAAANVIKDAIESETKPQIQRTETAPFRGRLWNPGGPPPRYRGRGFDPNSIRGRNGQPGPYFRERGGPYPGRFPPPNFDPNWMSQHGDNGTINAMHGPQSTELWIETKSEDGKSYFYHAITRETTWTKPEGPNIKIMTQAEVELMNAKTQNQNINNYIPNDRKGQNNVMDKENENKNDSHLSQMPNTKNKLEYQNMNSMPQQPTNFFPGSHFGNIPFGMPPPGFGGNPPNPWGMQWNPAPNPHFQEQQMKNLVVKPGIIDPFIIAKAAEWSEHRAPDGRPYYYHAIRGESVWEKPQAIRNLEAARMAAHSGTIPQANIHPPTITPAAPISSMPANSNSVNDSSTAERNESKNENTNDINNKEVKSKNEVDKKKEEKKKQNKIQDKTKPISSTPITGTPWCVVWTGDGKVFFYNPSARTSVWERPEELLDRSDVDQIILKFPEEQEKPENKEAKNENNAQTQPITHIESESSIEEVPFKKAKIVTASENTEKNEQKKQPDDIAKEAAVEAEVRAAKERALVPLEVRVNSFKEMLKEKEVSAFSTWEKELHKIVFDQRYLLLTSRERKQVFEKYVKERAEEERKEKRNKMRQKKEDFKKLMESANLHGRSSFSEFSQKYGKDERYKGIEKIRERESLFNEFIIQVRRREKEEKNSRKEQIKKEFFAMLRERDDLNRHTKWSYIKKRIESDYRYKAIDSSSLKEEYFIEYCKMLKDERKKQKDKDNEKKDKKSDKKEKTKKDQIVDKDSKDEDKEDKKNKKEENKKEEDQKDRDKQLRAEQSIKEREKEVQRTLANHLRDRDKEREHHKRDEAIQHFNALLTDLVRNTDLTWKEVKRQLRKDHRWELVENLDREHKEKLFDEHIDLLMRKKRDKFREMLDELPGLELTSSWKDIKKKIRDDVRYTKYNNSEKCEREFKDYIKDKILKAKAALKELLQECKFITHKSFEMVQENSSHFKDIEEILKNDKRYLVLDHIPQERKQIIMIYLEDLHKKGPPPPPTASESTRRK